MCILCVLNKTFELKQIAVVNFSLHTMECIALDLLMLDITDYGRPMKPFFHQNIKLLDLGR